MLFYVTFLATSVSVNSNLPQSTVSPQTPQRVATRERRQRSNDGSGRRRTPRNRNSVNLQQTPVGPQVNGAINGTTGNQKIDLPPGYGKFCSFPHLYR